MKSRKGFKLIDMLILICILGIVAVIFIPQFTTEKKEIQECKFEKYSVSAFTDGRGRHLQMEAEDPNNESTWGIILVALDKGSEPDGRFDKIILDQVPKGHALEKYASLEKLEEVYEYIKEQGKVVEY